MGMTVPNFPNLWIVYGPNTHQKTGGPIMWSELEARYIMGCIKAMVDGDLASLEVKQEVFDDFQRKLDAAYEGELVTDKRVTSYYRSEKHGRVDVMTPWGTEQFVKWTRTPNLDDYVVTPAKVEAGLRCRT